jgi:hypothetical protein
VISIHTPALRCRGPKSPFIPLHLPFAKGRQKGFYLAFEPSFSGVTSGTGTGQQKNTELRCDDQGLWKKRGFEFSLLYYVNSDIKETKAKAEGSGERKRP